MEPDEKVCPYCAEVIKSAAIKCRYCRSDLPVEEESEGAEASVQPDAPTEALGEVEVEETPVVEPEEPAEATVAPDPEPANPFRAALADRVVVSLVVLSLLLVGGLVWIVLASRTGDLAVAGNDQVTATPYRNAAMSAASANVTTVLSYAHKSLDKDAEAARKVLTPEYFEKDYQATMTERNAEILESKLTQVATVLSTSIVSLTPEKATVMLLTNIISVPEGSKSAPPQILSRLLVTMEREDGDWIVSQMTGF